MYRVFLFITFLAYCSSAPFATSKVSKPVFNEQDDVIDLVDTPGGGYSYFKKQKIDVRPSTKSSIDIPMQDLTAYMQANAFRDQPGQKQTFSPMNNILLNNAFGQQQLIPRAKAPLQNLLPKPVPMQPPTFIQNDYSQFPSNNYAAQQGNFPIQSQLFSNQQTKDLRGIGSHLQQQMLNNFGNQQPHQIWNTQQKSNGFSSSYGGQGQPPVSSGFLIQSNQQNDQAPITNALFMSSPLPPQRFNPTNQHLSNNGW